MTDAAPPLLLMVALGLVSPLIAIIALTRGARTRELDATNQAQQRLDLGLRALDDKLSERIDARAAVQDKARHDLGNACSSQLAEQRRDLADLRAKAVTREDMTGFKAEMKADFARLEAKIDRLIEGGRPQRQPA